MEKKLNFANEYLSKFTQFGNYVLKYQSHEELYTWLTQNEPEIQIEVGILGTLDNGHCIISNAIPMLALVGRGKNSYADMYEAENQIFNCKHALTRYIGVTKRNLREAEHALINPIKWIHTAILLPFYVFRWLGFKSSSVKKLEINPLIRLIASFFLLIQIIAAIITILDFIN